MTRFVAASLFCLVAFQAQKSTAQDQDGFANQTEGLGRECLADDVYCYRLFTRCEPIQVSVYLSENEIGLTEERIRNVVESRLRAARLYDQNDSRPLLTVSVDMMAEREFTVVPYSLEIEFHKWLFDDITGREFIAGIYDTANYGRSGDAGFIIQIISEHMDRFINEYLRINESACD